MGHGEGGWAQVAEREGARVRVSRGRAWERGAKDLVEESRGEGCTHHTYNRLCYDSFFPALLHADTLDCLLSPLPHPLIGLLYFYDLI